MRADRLIALALLLQARGRMTAEDLAARLEVSVRTVYRDLDALSAAGVPVYADRGPGGGVALPDGYRVDLTALNPNEASALFLSATPGRLADLGVDAVLEGALRKLSAALPEGTRQQAERARQRVHVDPTGWWWGKFEPLPHLRTLQEGLNHERRLLLHYTRPNGEAVSRLVDPLGLVVKVNVWYFVARLAEPVEARETNDTHEERDLRVFRVSRLREVTLTDEPAQRPPDFDLPTYWADWCARFARTLPQYAVTLRVAPDFLPELRRRLWRVGQSELPEDAAGLEREAEGWVTLPPVDLENFELALESVLSVGRQVEVLAPPKLRQAVAEHAAALAARYGMTRDEQANRRPTGGSGAVLPAGGDARAAEVRDRDAHVRHVRPRARARAQ
ncbi:MAG TPA: WYL domain-containing protein [Chloroflexota bacterium]|nr:WYL domain-containing protein [Chloroflexota bacterium]